MCIGLSLLQASTAICGSAGEVYRCLVHNYDDLDPGCKKEIGRAVHMAFFIWAPGAILTKDCDADVTEVCLKDRPNMDRIPGAVGACLADVVSWQYKVACELVKCTTPAGTAVRYDSVLELCYFECHPRWKLSCLCSDPYST